jgi:hypothetical protein
MTIEIRDLVPELSTCLMYNDRIPNFWFDPPIALTKQTVMTVQTPYAKPAMESAASSSTISSAVPIETGSDPDYSETMSAETSSGGKGSRASTSDRPAETDGAALSTGNDDTNDLRTNLALLRTSIQQIFQGLAKAPVPSPLPFHLQCRLLKP